MRNILHKIAPLLHISHMREGILKNQSLAWFLTDSAFDDMERCEIEIKRKQRKDIKLMRKEGRK